MLQRLRVVPAPLSATYRESFSLAEVTRRVRDLDETLDPETPRFKAAVLLLSAAELGQNLYRLSLFTGVDARFVSRCARHMIDNGVWVDGITLAGWRDPEVGPLAFWADVQVALGHACRRADGSGMLRWAPAGEWRKRFDYGSPKFDEACVTYDLPMISHHDRSEGAERIGMVVEDRGDEDAVDEAWRRGVTESAVPGMAAADWIGLGPGELGRIREMDEVASPAIPEAIWLG